MLDCRNCGGKGVRPTAAKTRSFWCRPSLWYCICMTMVHQMWKLSNTSHTTVFNMIYQLIRMESSQAEMRSRYKVSIPCIHHETEMWKFWRHYALGAERDTALHTLSHQLNFRSGVEHFEANKEEFVVNRTAAIILTSPKPFKICHLSFFKHHKILKIFSFHFTDLLTACFHNILCWVQSDEDKFWRQEPQMLSVRSGA